MKSSPSVGIATLTIVASRTVMIAPRTTTAASFRISAVSAESLLWAVGAAWVVVTMFLPSRPSGRPFGLAIDAIPKATRFLETL
jgi:hypothetical protein